MRTNPIVRGANTLYTKSYAKVYLTLNALDRLVVKLAVRAGNHAAALVSLAYFGLISMTSMTTMSMPGKASALSAAITAGVGSTSNAAFGQIFGTLVTPANFVFFIWPIIASLQLGTLLFSLLRPARGSRKLPLGLGKLAGAQMAQTELTSLALANVVATRWLLLSSNAASRALPLGCALTLPLVPLFAAFPLRSSTPLPVYRPVFQTFSAFTTLAAALAACIELQHGGRLPWLYHRPEACASLFTAVTLGLVAMPSQSVPKLLVNVLVLSGILWKRVAPLLTGGGSAAASSIGGLLLSPSFDGILVCWAWAAWKLAGKLRPRARWTPAPAPARPSSQRNDGPGFGDRGVFF